MNAVWFPRGALAPVIRLRDGFNVVVCQVCGLDKPVGPAGYAVLNLTEVSRQFQRGHVCRK